MENLVWAFIFGASGLSLIYSLILIYWVLRQPAGDKKMQEVAKAIQIGASSYLTRQYSLIATVGLLIFIILWWKLNFVTGLGFAVGAIASALAGYVGMSVAVRANVRTAEAAKKKLSSALSVAFKGGARTGMIVVGLALLSVAGYYWLLTSIWAY